MRSSPVFAASYPSQSGSELCRNISVAVDKPLQDSPEPHRAMGAKKGALPSFRPKRSQEDLETQGGHAH